MAQHARRLRLAVLAGLLLATAGASAQQLGRLFTTPAERASIDDQRRRAPLVPASTPASAPASAAVPVPAPATAVVPGPAVATGAPDGLAPIPAAIRGARVIVVNGQVTRSGAGPVMTWVDAVPYGGPASLQGGAVLGTGRAGQVTVVLRSGKRVTLKPGQEVDTVSGQVREAYQAERGQPPRDR